MTFTARIQLSSHDLVCARNGAVLTAAGSALVYAASIYWLGRSVTYFSIADRLLFGAIDGAVAVLATDKYHQGFIEAIIMRKILMQVWDWAL